MELDRFLFREHVHHISLLSLLGVLWPSAASIAVERPEEYVNVLAGASSQKAGQHHSTGNTLPLAARPWGFNHWAPQTTMDQTSWWSDMQDNEFHGIRCTHQPSPWIGDYGWFLLRLGTANGGQSSYTTYSHPDAVRPYKIDLLVGPYNTRVELAPTKHSAILRVKFTPSTPADKRIVCAWVPRGKKTDEDEIHAKTRSSETGSCKTGPRTIDLQTSRFASGIPKNTDFVMYAHIEASNSDLEMAEVPDYSDCYQSSTKYDPLNMGGQQRTQEKTLRDCQKRCESVVGCAHFTYWVDGGCHLADSTAKTVKDPSGTAGPPVCPFASVVRECCFKLNGSPEVEVRIGTSFISSAQSTRALEQEVREHTLDSVATEGQEIWREMLSRVEVVDAGPPVAATWQHLEVFYTCLYRVLLFPRRLDETTPDGGVYHWSPYDGDVHEGIIVTDNGFWDTFRTVYPFLSLAYPNELGEFLEGWLNAYREGGWLPKWASPGYRDSMIGTFADVVLADAILKGIPGFNYSTAWEAIRKDAFDINPEKKDTSRGKFGLGVYMNKSYIPIDSGISEACSRTLDFAYADAAAAQVGQKLGHREHADILQKRSKRALEALYDGQTHLMGHKTISGKFKVEPPETWGDCFTEGSSWHHSFPPFDIDALVRLHGGKTQLLEKLRQIFDTPGTFNVGSYKVEIHEMREMRQLGMGQYAHNNQPVHHLPYMFAMLGDRKTTASLVNDIMLRAYSIHGFAGDEDNGEMSAWYLLSALGLYAPNVGVSDEYVLGAVPIFPRVLLRDLDITIEAPSASVREPELGEVLWRSRAVDGPSVPYSELRHGGVLRFVGADDPRAGGIVSKVERQIDRAEKAADRAVAKVSNKFRRSPSRYGEERHDGAFFIMGSIGLAWLALSLLRWLCKAVRSQTSQTNDKDN